MGRRDAPDWIPELRPVVGLRYLLRRNVKRFRGGLVFKAHRPLYHSTLGSRVIKKKHQEMGLPEKADVVTDLDLAEVRLLNGLRIWR